MALIDVVVDWWGPAYTQRFHQKRVHPATMTLTTGGTANWDSNSSLYAPMTTTLTGAITYEYTWYQEWTKKLWRGWSTIVPEVPLSGFEPESSA